MSRHVLSEDSIDPAIREAVSASQRGIVEEVQALVAAHDVVVVGMKQNPFPKKARKALTWRPRTALKMWTGWPTFPMVFVKGVLVGGAQETIALIASGELAKRLGT
jgi:hypothetical protein